MATAEAGAAWVVVLVKDFDSAKRRLGPVLDPGERRLVVAGSAEVAAMAERLGSPAVLEPRQLGQNVAAQRGIAHAVRAGAGAVLLLSSDLPLVTQKSVRELLDFAGPIASPVAVAVPAIGRGGTNALYLRRPDAIALHFGADSLASFRREAAAGGVRFEIHSSEAMALDLDEPPDLARLRHAV